MQATKHQGIWHKNNILVAQAHVKEEGHVSGGGLIIGVLLLPPVVDSSVGALLCGLTSKRVSKVPFTLRCLLCALCGLTL